MFRHRELYDDLQRFPYLASTAMVIAVTGIGFLAESVLHAANLDTVYLLAVFLSALFCGERPAIFTAVLGTPLREERPPSDVGTAA